MRKYLLIIALASTTSFLRAQIVNIPDAQFKAVLLAYTPTIDLNNDKEIQVSEAIMVKKLNLSYKFFTNLTGIEAFTSLTYFDCHGMPIFAFGLDVSKNTALTYLNCSNSVSSLDVSKNTALDTLICSSNFLSTLNVSQNTALTYLHCSQNKLTNLDVSKNIALKYLYCSDNQLNNLDVSNNTSLALLDCSYNQSIVYTSPETGEEFQTSPLTTLDISKNSALVKLYCNNNELTTLDLSKNTALTILSCYSNQLSTLDVSKNAALTFLECENNQLTTLDVSKNIALKDLYCKSNQISTICINPTQETFSWQKDATAQYSTTCTTTTALEDSYIPTNKQLHRIITPLGQETKPEQANEGIFIYQYSDGSTRKIAR